MLKRVAFKGGTAMFKRLFSICAISALTGCATGPQQPPEAPISVQLAGSAVEVQDFIQHRSMTRGSSALQVETANDRTLIMKGLCTALPDMTPFKCSMIMMAVGNSQWDGPYAVMTFRTNEVRGNVNLTLQAQWCATNPFGKTNCMNNGTARDTNELLRKIKSSYDSEKAEARK